MSFCGGPQREKNDPSSVSRGRSWKSLSTLCMEVIVTKLERYPSQALGALSELEWESIISMRHELTSPQNSGKRLAPAVSHKVMTAVESTNPHLAQSSRTDILIWKDCVEYKFRLGGPSRPACFKLPWPLLVNSLTKASSDLQGLLKPAETEQDEGKERALRMRILHRSIRVLEESPMNVALLTATGVGKVVQKFIKASHKAADQQYFPVDVWSESLSKLPSPQGVKFSPLQQLEQLLQGWKEVASSAGVGKDKTSKHTNEDATAVGSDSGKGRKTTQEQEMEDMTILQSSCSAWRHMFSALEQREAKMRASHGARMRQIRQTIESDRSRIRKVTLRAANPKPSKLAKQESILSGERGARAKSISTSSSSSSFMSGGTSKMQAIRQESAVASSWQKNGVAKPRSSFGASIANAHGVTDLRKKRATSSREVSLGNGKQLTLPRRAPVGAGAALYSKAKKKEEGSSGMSKLDRGPTNR
uniref:Uncharacterized protein n=1 Tax=Attheya septentrionalis TaxID=420275 RepID=A0A7S2URW4_9STRA|mmetsp:Transcript_7429/g.13358  ORF Transcript_7429/g.13358 Transcript_7429/m.13358 type:complete len:476 (+) Transcript_7429:80-1507(+)